MALMPGLLLFQAMPVTAAVRAVTSVQGTPDTPEQLTGSAEGLPSLVDTKATQPGDAAQDKKKNPGPSVGELRRPKGGLPLDVRNFQPVKEKFTQSSPGKSDPIVLLPEARNRLSLMGMWISDYYPDDQTQVDTLTPELNAYGYNGGNGGPYYEYQYEVCEWKATGTAGPCTLSAWRHWIESEWIVPAGVLQWGKTYVWKVTIRDTTTQETGTRENLTFTTAIRQPVVSSHLAERGVNGQEFHQLAGNYTTTVTDASVATAGPPLSVTRSYNSLDGRIDGMFGPGWSTRYDMKIQPEGGTPQTLLLTYPDGRKLRFVEKRGSTVFQSPPGMHVTLAAVTGGGWRLMDKSSISYTFDAQGRLSKLTDSHGRAQNLTYGTDGKLATVTAAGGRSLTFTWTGAHVTAVATDPVDGQPLRWTYVYDGQRLSQACSPTAAPNCTTYDYATGSRYRASVLDDRPRGYWRMGEVRSESGEGGTYTYFPDETGLTGHTYLPSGLQTGKPGALGGTSNAAANFQGSGTSSGISHWGLFPELGKSMSVESWFKTNDSGFIFWSGRSLVGWNPASPGDGVPGLYVGVDGKLRGQLQASVEGSPYTPITSAQAVNDGQWHHAVITATGNVTTLYVDGAAAGTGTGNMGVETYDWMSTTVIGSGGTDSRLPGSPAGRPTPVEFGFKGLIDEFAVYDRALSAAQVRAHYDARTEAPFKLSKTTLPSGRVWMSTTYNPANDRVLTHTDQHGGTWKLGDPVHAKTGGLTTITVTDPNTNTLKYDHDARRGDRLVSQTDQLGKITSYAYDTGGFLAKVTDPNNNFVEQVNDARGNVIAVKTCRTATSCQTARQSFYRNTADEFDPRNDRVTVSRDARSASATDNTYATTRELTARGDVAKVTSPATPDFPTGRSVTSTYTDGTEAAVGGGTTPAGLVKSQKDAKGNESTYRYSAAGDLAEQTSPAGLKVTFAYDSLGRVTSRTEVSAATPDGVTSTFAYDGLGRVLTQTGAGVKNEVTNVTHTAKSTFTYDADGRTLTATVTDVTGGDPARTTTYTYDGHGRVETVTDPEGGVVRATRDATGALASTTDPMGTVLTYAYTKRGEPFTTTIKNWTGSPVSPQAPQDVVLESRSYDPAGRLATQADAMGRKTSYIYFTDNRLSQVIADDVRLNGLDTATDVVLQDNTYDPAGHLTKKVTDVDKDKKATTDYVYDAAGRLTSTTFDPATLKRKAVFDYDAAGNIIKKTFSGAGDTRTESTAYVYNALNLVTRQTVENGDDDLISTWAYDDRGLVTAVTDPRGNASGATAVDFTATMRYDLAGRLVESKAPQVKIEKNGSAADGRPTVRFGYNSVGLATHTVDAEGRTLTSTFDKAGRLTSATSPSYTPPGGATIIPKVSLGYDAAGREIKVTDPRGYVATIEYDALGRPVRATDPGPSGPGGQWVAEYSMLGEQLAVVDPVGARSEATYDELGRMITATQIERTPTAAAYTTTMAYDLAGNLAKSVAPGNKTTSYTVNVAGQVTAVTDPNNKTSTISYDFLGREAKVADPRKNATQAEYDLAGRKIGSKDLSKNPDGTETVVRAFGFGYDPAGNPISTTSGEGHLTRRKFDAAGRLTSLIEPVSADKTITTTFGYDATGARTRLTDGGGNATWTSYNTMGLAESVIEPATAAHPNAADRTWTSVYDAAGNAVATLQPGGVRTDRTFDHLDQMVKQTGTGASVATPERNLTYDTAGRVTAIGDYTLDYNDRSLLTKVSKAANQVAAYAYDGLGNTTQRVDPTGTANYTYDNASNLKTATDPVTGRTWTYDYDDANRLTSQTSANPVGSQVYTYDAVDRLASHTLKNSGGTELSKIVYGWDKDDNLTSKTTSGTAGAGANTYGYDHSGRLTSWTAPGGATTAYGWDDAGNRTKAGSKTFVYDERNRLTSGGGVDYTYTPRGTLATETTGGVTKNLVFDAFDQMISDGEASYGYDALGRMMSRTAGSEQQRFTYSGLSNDLITIANASNVTAATYGRDPFGGLLSLQEGTGPALDVMSDLHSDVVATFSGTALVDSVAYDPFGEVTHRSGTARTLGYQGEYTDPDTGKVNMHARWYQPGTGAFASRDTATLNPDPSVQANRYTYGNAGPLTNTDPTGHSTVVQTGGSQNGASGGSGWQSYNWADSWQPRSSGWDYTPPEVTPGKPYYAWSDQPCECAFNGAGKKAQAWWEKRFGIYANQPQLTEEEARRWGLLPNGRPMPEDMEDYFWNSPESAQQKFLVMYNVEQMYSADWDDYRIFGYWLDMSPPPPPAAGSSAAGPADCATQFSKKACEAWREAARHIIYAREFSKSCTKMVLSDLEKCTGLALFLGFDVSKVQASTGFAALDALAELVKPLMDPINQVANFFFGDAVDCFNGDAVACALFAANFAAPPAAIASKIARAGKAFAGAKKLMETAAKECRRSSFLPGTKVLMADGSHKPIEEVGVGDRVLATDPETGETGARRVTALITSKGVKNLVRITVDTDGARGNETGAVIATDTHPFWLSELQKWRAAGELQQGQRLRTSAGTYNQVVDVAQWTVADQRVHNLTVDDLHTYHVAAGDQNLLVHNSGSCLAVLNNWTSKRLTFGNQTFLLDKKAMKHFLTRHHPKYWDGSTKASQSFFDAGMSVSDIEDAIKQVMQQNRATLTRRGGRGKYQISGTVKGTKYVLGLNHGRIGQFYPVPK
ncbi:polymorphic toxin-type HINT domain-containing protein [Streptosporangium roseum]|uniref:polymorphic toxin-type HINT domain-containing protein n=1 Tax=Streptosporangium roseum TaxID=2001 RepID=UPI003326A4C9